MERWTCNIGTYLSSLWTSSGHQEKLAHEPQISAPIRRHTFEVSVSYKYVAVWWTVLLVVHSLPGSPADQTCAATPGWPRWPDPVWRPGSEAWSACSVCSQPPGGCRLSGWPWSQGCLFLQASARPPCSKWHLYLHIFYCFIYRVFFACLGPDSSWVILQLSSHSVMFNYAYHRGSFGRQMTNKQCKCQVHLIQSQRGN